MNYIYPAIFYPEANGKYSVIFPDLNDLATYGDSLADAFAMAQEACAQYLFTSLRDGDALPAPTAINAVKSDDPTADIRDSHSSVQTSFKVRESNHSQSQRRYSFASC